MGGFALLSNFACDHCESPSIMLPDCPCDDSLIRCSGCGSELGSWGGFKARARQVIMDEVKAGVVDRRSASSDFAVRL